MRAPLPSSPPRTTPASAAGGGEARRCRRPARELHCALRTARDRLQGSEAEIHFGSLTNQANFRCRWWRWLAGAGGAGAGWGGGARACSDGRALRLQQEAELEAAAEHGSLLEFHPSWPAEEQTELRARVQRDMLVLPGFITEQEEDAFLQELEPVLRRMRYQFDHWDDAIHGYRETERACAQWGAVCAGALGRVRAQAFAPGSGAGAPLPHAHVLDLAPAGHIKPHIDALRFCGEAIAGVCLSSRAVLRLAHAHHAHLALDALLPRRCLYVMRGVARHEFTHAVPGGAESTFRGAHVHRARRVAVITRSSPEPQHQLQRHQDTEPEPGLEHDHRHTPGTDSVHTK